MTTPDPAKYQPLLKEAYAAFLQDANYAIAIAGAGAAYVARISESTGAPASPGV